MQVSSICVLAVTLGLLAVPTAQARDAARTLSRFVGWTIVDAVTISESSNSDGDMVLKLSNGSTVRLSMCLILPPLALTDAVILGKNAAGTTMLKILVDDEVCEIAGPRSP